MVSIAVRPAHVDADRAVASALTSITSWPNRTSTFGSFADPLEQQLRGLELLALHDERMLRVVLQQTRDRTRRPVGPLGRSQNWKIGATSPTRAMSSARPSSASRSSVAGWVVAARGSVCGPSLSSNSRTGDAAPAEQPGAQQPDRSAARDQHSMFITDIGNSATLRQQPDILDRAYSWRTTLLRKASMCARIARSASSASWLRTASNTASCCCWKL